MIQDMGVKRDFFEVLAKRVSYETTPDWLWPCNLMYVPVCQLGELKSKSAINHAVQNMNTLSATALQLCSVFVTCSLLFYVIFFILS